MSEDLELKQWISDDEEPAKTLITEQQQQDILSDDQEEEAKEDDDTAVTNKSADAKQMKEDLMKEVEKRANANCTVTCYHFFKSYFHVFKLSTINLQPPLINKGNISLDFLLYVNI